MILITGASGFIGRQLVKKLALTGPLRLLDSDRRHHRKEGYAENIDGVELFPGSLWEEESLFRAVNGAHTIIHLENAMWWGGQRDLERIEVVGTRNLIAAARSARVGRIITLSHLGCSPSSAFTLLRIKGQVEKLIMDSGLAYTIIRSGVVFGPGDSFINNIALMLRLNPFFFLMPGIGEVVLHPIYMDDLTESIVRSLSRVSLLDKTVEIGGAEYITLEDLLRTVMRVTGMRRPIVSAPPYALRWRTSLTNLIFPRSLMTQQWLDLLAANRTASIGNVYQYFGVEPRRFEDALLSYLPMMPKLFPALRYTFRRRPRE